MKMAYDAYAALSLKFSDYRGVRFAMVGMMVAPSRNKMHASDSMPCSSLK